jgi:two-component system chemotaxis response regulator CheB
MKKIKVLIVDDSAVIRDILERGLGRDPALEVVGKAGDVYVARDKIVFKKPDVVTLDVEMPGMDGLEFLKRLMPQYPVPVVMVSAMTEPGAAITLEALAHGAVDFVLKPSRRTETSVAEMVAELVGKIKAAAGVDVSRFRKYVSRGVPAAASKVLVNSTDKVIAIGASTGGTVAIASILRALPSDVPGTIVVQHMPPGFTAQFAASLDAELTLSVKEAADGDRLVTGQVLIAPGGPQARLERSGGVYVVRCAPGEKVNGHSPSVDVLFDSAAAQAGSNAVGVLLTGMGRDGAEGLLRMRVAGARTIAQDEASSIVFGMPKEAYALGAVDRLHGLDDIPAAIVDAVNDMKGGRDHGDR